MEEITKADKKLIDLRGSVCPFTLILTHKEVNKLSKGTIVEILVTDPSACSSIPAWAEKEGHKVLEVKDEGEHVKIVLLKT